MASFLQGTAITRDLFVDLVEELEEMLDLGVEQGGIDGQTSQRQRQQPHRFGARQRVLRRNSRTQSLDELQKLDLPC